MDKTHGFLCRKSHYYHKWHQHPHHRKVHHGILLSVIFALAFNIFWQVSDLAKNQVHAAPEAYTVTARESWEAGTNTNLDTEAVPGDLLITADGTWGARTWKTPPDIIGSGMAMTNVGSDIYVLRGYNDSDFWKYSSSKNEWTVLADSPHSANVNSYIQKGDNDTIYAIFGQYIRKFYKYTISTNSWTQLADTPDTTGPGSALAYDGTNVYLLRGVNTQDFYIYEIATNSWSTSTGPPATVNNASDLVYDGSQYLYTLRGNNTTTVYRYDTNSQNWSTMSTSYPTNINESTIISYVSGALYVQHPNSTNFYKCTISGLTCQGGSWSTLATLPVTSRYAGIVYNSSDGYMYVFRGNNTQDFWKYNIATNTFVGPEAFPQNITTGADLIWDGGNYVYGFKGGAAANGFYYYDITTNAWAARSTTGLPTISYDTTAVKAGNYIYVFQGNSTNFYRYDTTNDAGGWTAMGTTPATIRDGGSLSYPGSGDYIYATRGLATNTFYAYSIANNNWTTFDPPDLPSGVNVYYGGRLISDGTNIFATIGNGTSLFYKYNVGAQSWTQVARAPFSGYYGTELAYNNGKIYALAGSRSNRMYEYNISGNSWRKLLNFQSRRAYDEGAYNGASLVYIGSNTLMATLGGGNNNEVLTYTIGSGNYFVSGSYESPAIDLTYVSSWVSLTLDQNTPGNSSTATETRTSDDGSSWTSWQALSGTTIQSPAKKYIQIKITLNATSDSANTPAVHSYSLVYNPDEEAPENPSSFSCLSQAVGGEELTSGQAYLYSHPVCSWSGASDSKSGIAGYYVYFGPNASANPTTDGTYQTNTEYSVNSSLGTGNNYLIIKAKDVKGNEASSSVTGFTYVYNGVSPVQEKNITTQGDFDGGTLTNLSSVGDQLKLSGKSGFWKETNLSVTPAAIGYGGSFIYKSSVNKFYVLRGANTTTFWEYDIATDSWATKSSTGLGSVNYGGQIVNGPGNYVYAMRGGNTNTFYRYDITNDAAGWIDVDAEDSPTAFGYGGSLVYDGTRYIYALRGNNDDVFYRFDPQTTADGQWASMANANFGYPDQTSTNAVNNGGCLAYNGANTIYAMQGNSLSGGFAKYNISGNSWTPLTPLPNAPGAGAFLVWNASRNALYYLPGSGIAKMYKFDVLSEEWTKVSSAPSSINYGSFMQSVGGEIYTLRGNSTSFYKYSTAKDSWYLPAFNVFGPNWNGTSFFTTNYGSSIVYGGENNFYAIRGYYDSRFVHYNSETGAVTRLADLPTGTYSGASMVYNSTDNAIYMISGTENAFFKFDIASNTWSQVTSDPPPIQSGYGSSMVYDGSRYIYYTRGANTTSWYRYDTQGSAGSRWSSALPTTGFGGQGYGSQLLYKDGYLYTLRGQNVNPNPFYKFDVSQLPGGSWTSLSSLSTAVYNDGFLVDGNNGYLYAARASNTKEWWQYNIGSNQWSTAPDFPGQIYTGGAGRSNGLNKILVLPGAGSNTWQDGIFTYVTQSDNSSFEENGTYTSESFDLTSVYQWANLTTNYTTLSNTSILIETQSSDDNNNWSTWSAVTQEKVNGTSHEFSINSPAARYLKVRITMTSGDGVLSPTLTDFKVNYYQDIVPPSNPTALSSAKSQASGGFDITSDNWYKYSSPYFTWPTAGVAPGAVDNSGGSGVVGYWVYFGTDPDGVPSTLGTYQTGLNYTASSLTHGETYYLRIQTKDNAGNTQGTVWTAFTYKYDTEIPDNPSTLTVNPVGYTNIDNYTFSISSDASDNNSGLLKYQYRTGGDTPGTWYDFNPALSTSVTIPNAGHPAGKYQSGINQFYFRVMDNAGNTSGQMNAQYYFGNEAPSPPQNLTVDPETNTVNNFTFEWDPPVSYIGDVNKITYYYSVNAHPTQYNTNSTSAAAAGPSPFATQKGDNIFYVVAKDEAGNISYDQYAQVTFNADTSAPGAPTALNVSDISDKEANQYRLVISWMAPEISDLSNFAGYDIYESGDPNGTFSKIANTTGTAYVQTGLTKDSRHYYYVKSTDKTGNSSAPSSTSTAVATGRYTKPPNIVQQPTVSPKAFSANIKWGTSREANSAIEYGKTQTLGKSTGNSPTQFVTSHEVIVGNLEPSTTYYYRVVFIDPDGNTGTSGIGSFITSPAPSVSSLKVEDITLSTMWVSWDSNVPSYGQIVYGATKSFGSAVSEDPFYTTHHRVKLTNLVSGTRYFLQVQARDNENNAFNSDVYEKETLPVPKVENVTVENKANVDNPTLIISYKTNVDTTTIVRYRPVDGDKEKEFSTASFSKTHNLELADLLPTKLYNLSITGRDKYGNEAEPQVHTVTTKSDTMPPKVLKIIEKKRVVGEGTSAEAQLVIKISTNESSTMVIEASEGVGNSDFKVISNEDPLSQEHNLTGKLGKSGQSYSYRVRLKDASGNETLTDVKSFVIAQVQRSALEYILDIFSRNFGWFIK